MSDTDRIKNIIIEELDDYVDDYISVEDIEKSTGVKGDVGLYGSIIVINLRSINWRKLKKIQSRITNELPDVSRVLIEI